MYTSPPSRRLASDCSIVSPWLTTSSSGHNATKPGGSAWMIAVKRLLVIYLFLRRRVLKLHAVVGSIIARLHETPKPPDLPAGQLQHVDTHGRNLTIRTNSINLRWVIGWPCVPMRDSNVGTATAYCNRDFSCRTLRRGWFYRQLTALFAN